MSSTDTQALKVALSKPSTLHSVFDRVEVEKHAFKEDRRSALPKVVLNADGLAEEFKRPVDTDLKGYFDADLERLQNLPESAPDDTLPYLFQKYGWRIADPEDPAKYPDAAFCDRFRVAKALEKPGTSGGYLLVKGDLTGIQEYIYHGIQPGRTGGLGNLAKRLRARSVLVSLLTDFVANVILRELGLSSWHLLFAGGGHFNLILPDDREEKLNDLASNISAALRHQFGERLELIVAHKKYDRAKLESEASRCFEEVNAKRDELKYRQHLGGLSGLFEEKIDNSVKKKKEREEREQRIGRAFPKQKFLLEIVSDKVLKGDVMLATLEPNPSHFHTLVAVQNLEDGHEKSAQWFLDKNKGNGIQSVHILALNDTNFLPDEDWKSDFNFPVSFGFRFLGKNAPRPKPLDEQGKEIADAAEIEDADLLDFNQIAQIGHEGRLKGDGFVRLGSIMLDVDNLGLVFSNGIKDASLAQIITLSREMNYFFTAHFDQRAQENRVYVVYSGGDDAFAVGKWDMLMGFAKTLRKDFQTFICYEENKNPDVHFSAGIFMSNPHYPVGRFYKDTKDLQDRAKDTESKNRVDVFDYTLGWDGYEVQFDLGNQFKAVLEKGQTASGRKFNSSFVYRIMQLVKTSYYERDEWIKGEFHRRGHLRPDKFARNIARMHYLFARNGFSAEDSQKISDELEKHLMHSFLKNAMKPEGSGKFEARDYLVALNFAILQVRSTSKNI